ncbi:MAG: radical SAM protein, partial [Candidatus Omnitrophica bacterium]|nr:radical SAM protein [Candidatus Omnitrophota bacterium]
MPKILFTSVYQPFATFPDGSSMMDLYAGRLTIGQQIFTFESYYPPLPLHLIAQNISAPSTVLENPTLPTFIRELKKGYDYVGIHFAASLFYEKVLTMCRLIKEISPQTKIILGGYGVVCLDQNFEQEAELRQLADYVCRSEGIRFMRELLGDPLEAPIS